MEGAVLPSSKQRSPDHHRIIPERPRKTPNLPTSAARMSAFRLVGQELKRLKGDELVSSHNRNSEDSQGSVALASMDDASEQTDKLPVLARHADSVMLSRGRERFTPSRVLDRNPSVQLSKNPDADDEEESELALTPEEECLSLPASSAYVLERRENPPEGFFLSPRVVDGDGHPERFFGEDRERDQRISPGTTVQQQWRSSTHFPVGEPASRLNDLDLEDTWRIPVVGGNTTRPPLIKLVLSWLTGNVV